ncbi:MAG: hypothetical protein M3R44_06855 [Candidatus Eremiobacteraeota bacterium]|nr:hypothetical protein [Candidatus Eremiobacteraeota bacterium]
MPLRFVRRVAIALCCSWAGAFAQPGIAAVRPVHQAAPAWLVPRAGTLVRVDGAPWFDSDEPEAALTMSPGSLRRDFSEDGTRPDDVVYEPVGVRARIARVLHDGIVLLHGTDRRWSGFAPLDRLVPEVPRGTRLVVAGGFGGFADFYPTLRTPEQSAARITTGTSVVALTSGVAPEDPGSANRVRLEVRVLTGVWHGSTGWLEVPYTGLRQRNVARNATTAERACSCRLLSFSTPP